MLIAVLLNTNLSNWSEMHVFCTLLHKSIHGSKSGSNGNGTGGGNMLELVWICETAEHDH